MNKQFIKDILEKEKSQIIGYLETSYDDPFEEIRITRELLYEILDMIDIINIKLKD